MEGKTLLSASTNEGKKGAKKTGGNLAAAKEIGKKIAEQAKAKGVTRSCSTAAAISITDASKRWPTPPAKQD